MLTGNNLTNLKRCLDSLGKTKYPSITFHILLNGSGVKVQNYLEALKKIYPFPIDVVVCPINAGIPVGLNWLHTRCTAPIVARLDDDMEMPDHWLAEMVELLRRNPMAGAVLPAMIHPSSVPDVPPEIVPPLRLCPYFPGMPNNMPQYRQTYRSNFMGGACVVFRKKAIELAGDYDIRLSPTQNEDVDYGVALRVQGYDLIVNGQVLSIHHSSSFAKTAFERTLGVGFQASYFYSKWGKACDILEFASDRDGRALA